MQGEWRMLGEDPPAPVGEVVLCYTPRWRLDIVMGVWDGERWHRPGYRGTLIPVDAWQPLPEPPE